MVKFSPFDVADYLDDGGTIAEYISAALKAPIPDERLSAVCYEARARDLAQFAKDTGLGSESFYRALKPDAKPPYDTRSNY
jgi:probable addiction module antidote protein